MSTANSNKLFPIFLKLENFRVLIVGGGKIGVEKLTAILNNSPATQIRLIANKIDKEIESLSDGRNNVILVKKLFEESDLEQIDFLIVATGNKETSSAIKKLAQQKGILTNVADTPEQCDFYLGSIVQKGDLKIAFLNNRT